MSKIVKAICPVCGKEYKYREEYAMNNRTCPTRECKDKLQKIEQRLRDNVEGCQGFEVVE